MHIYRYISRLFHYASLSPNIDLLKKIDDFKYCFCFFFSTLASFSFPCLALHRHFGRRRLGATIYFCCAYGILASIGCITMKWSTSNAMRRTVVRRWRQTMSTKFYSIFASPPFVPLDCRQADWISLWAEMSETETANAMAYHPPHPLFSLSHPHFHSAYHARPMFNPAAARSFGNGAESKIKTGARR